MSDRTLQNIFKAFGNALATTPQPMKNRKAIYAISHCRTEEMGTSYYACKNNHTIKHHHSCRHRSCYLCAQKKRLEWIESQRKRLFNTPHFHVVFTLPHEYLSLWCYNESRFMDLLFQASKETLLELIGDKKYHGITPGVLMAVHTWGRQLTLHPHTHCLVTAGGLNKKQKWCDVGEFLLPIRVVKTLYRAKMQALIKAAFDAGELRLPEGLSEVDFNHLYKSTYKKPWSVRIEERYEHGKGVMLYLSRYLKGGPINPAQIVENTSSNITFNYLDHRDKKVKPLALQPMAFLKRLLLHVPSIGKHTVRSYGLYATCNKRKHELCATQLGLLSDEPKPAGLTLQDMVLFCATCGGKARLSYRTWKTAKKGISINKEAGERDSARGFVQQQDEDILAQPAWLSSA